MTSRAALVERGKVTVDASLAPLTTYKLGGPARYLVVVDDEDDLRLASGLASEEGLPLVTLGRGSNMVVADVGFPGVVVRPGPGLSWWEAAGDDAIRAGSGMPLPLLARETGRAGLGGLEFFTGIPGSVGGAVRMNAGCHGSEVADWLVEARVMDLGTGEVSERTPTDLEMSYRHSSLTDDHFVVSARFRTIARDPSDAEEAIREITRWRREHQPGGTLNAGSVFKNPPGDSAGRVIDAAGLKGLRIGGAQVSERHANFFIAHDGATASDLHRLVIEVQRRILDEVGVELVPEIRFLGEFHDRTA
ncbi:MAG TPA: UDP-N-acetylmuramate dehydrogenase [Acidimicrobiia bacterium]|nr:UDP-N-acetylmuramate dehydrogenase [Acidimicrobiia bacterium]